MKRCLNCEGWRIELHLYLDLTAMAPRVCRPIIFYFVATIPNTIKLNTLNTTIAKTVFRANNEITNAAPEVTLKSPFLTKTCNKTCTPKIIAIANIITFNFKFLISFILQYTNLSYHLVVQVA